jgi:hypothetical protein
MSFAIALLILIAFSFLAYWRGSPVIFMLAAGSSIMAGLYTPDALGALGYTTFGMSFGLMLIAYSFVCIGLAYGNLFRSQKEE